MADPVAVEFEAELRQIKTMSDHSCNVVFNVPEYCVEQVQTMLMWLGDMVQIVAVDEGKPTNDQRKPTKPRF